MNQLQIEIFRKLYILFGEKSRISYIFGRLSSSANMYECLWSSVDIQLLTIFQLQLNLFSVIEVGKNMQVV